MSKINNKNSTIKRVLLQIRPYLPTIILLLALAVVSVLCSLYIPVLIGDAIDAIIGKEQVNFAVILPKLFTCAVLIGCAALAQWLMNVCGNKVTYNTIRDMREAALKKFTVCRFLTSTHHETGDIVSRIIADVDQFADGPFDGLLTAVYRRCDDHRHHRLHAFRQRLDNACRGACHAAFHFGGALHRKENVRHVPLTVRNTRPPDGIHQ